MKLSILSFCALSALTLSACAPHSESANETNTIREQRIGKTGTVRVDGSDIKVKTQSEINTKDNWFTKDPVVDGIPGTSADRAYTLSFAKAQVDPILVAVIDSGVDIQHEDLKEVMWLNLAEVNGTAGVDDDKNGYVDDINGWNYLGSYDAAGAATHIKEAPLEMTREAVRMKALKKAREEAGQALTPEELAYHDHITQTVDEERAAAEVELETWKNLKTKLLALAQTVASLAPLKEEELTFEAVTAATVTPGEESTKTEMLKLMVEGFLENNGSVSGIPRLNLRIDAWETDLKYYYNETFDPRKDIIGDDLSDFVNLGYGNNVVQGPLNPEGVADEASHGTHVAGIIAAKRENGIGINGIARDAKIISLRAVPNGDEWDKDVANAVRYAVDSGAKIINMSFGKYYSPYKAQVDEAFQYAASKGVLVVHAAGNESKHSDVDPSFPNQYLKADPLSTIKGWLNVGASSSSLDQKLVAAFSNYGKKAVHLFAPGVAVHSTVPGNKYESFNGTSMAAPSAAGVAALVWSQFPSLTMGELKLILLQSVTKYPGLDVLKPGTKELVLFETLSRTGGVINAYKAMLLACEYTNGDNCTP